LSIIKSNSGLMESLFTFGLKHPYAASSISGAVIGGTIGAVAGAVSDKGAGKGFLVGAGIGAGLNSAAMYGIRKSGYWNQAIRGAGLGGEFLSR
jgi:hypothetical protein